MPEQLTPQRRYEEIKVELHTLDSKISLIAQKIRMIEKNEEVIGRTIVLHNGKIRALESGQAGAPAAAFADQSAAAASSGLPGEVAGLKREVAALKKEVSELHYTLDSINPLEFITVSQARKVIAEELGKIQGK